MTLTFDLLTWISIGVIYSSSNIYLPSLKPLGQSVLELSVAHGEVDWLDLDLNINRGHLLIKDYLPTKFEASWGKHSWVISCIRLRDTDIPTDTCKAICPSFFKGGLKYQKYIFLIIYNTAICNCCFSVIIESFVFPLRFPLRLHQKVHLNLKKGEVR